MLTYSVYNIAKKRLCRNSEFHDVSASGGAARGEAHGESGAEDNPEVKLEKTGEMMNGSGNGTRKTSPLVALFVLALAQIGTSAENGAFSLATAEVLRVFGCSVAEVQLASTVYSLMAGTFMLASGLLGIVIGWSRTFRIGLMLVCAGELFCAFSTSIDLLIWGGRLLAGLGASLIIPSVLGMVPMLFEGERRKQAYGAIASSAAFATIVPIALGMLIDSVGYRFTFGVIAAYFAALLFASTLLPHEHEFGSARFDMPGAVVASCGLFMVMYGLSRVSVWGVIDPLPLAPFTIAGISPALPIVAVGLVLLVVLIPLERWMEERRGVAILPRSFVSNPQVRAGVIAIALPFFYMGAQGLVATSFYQLVVGLDATKTALLGIISGVPMLVLAMAIPRKWPDINHWAVVRAGYICIAVACAFMAAGVRETVLSPVMVAGTLFAGIGVGLVNSQANNIVASAVPARDSQQSGGIQGAARNLGLALGSAAVGSVLLIAMNSGMSSYAAQLPGIDGAHRDSLVAETYTYESDGAFVARMERLGVEGAQLEDLATENARTRSNAATGAMAAVAVISVLALGTTFPRTRPEAAE